tara:strand:+ start:198 stop:368 length:171 start_codon:yes stop_codon:yes gene_type:complete
MKKLSRPWQSKGSESIEIHFTSSRSKQQSMVSDPIDAPLANGLRKAKTQSFILELQ